MAMFGDLDRLNKQQQGVAAHEQQRATEKAQHRPTTAPLPSPTTAPAVTPEPPQAVAKKLTKLQGGRQPQANKPEIRQGTITVEEQARNRPTVRTNERTKIRHSFDIFSDQLFALRDLAYERERGSVKKVPLGDLVQEALDLYLAAQRNSK